MNETITKSSPTIQCITNYVTANDCANILLAIGASPTMATDKSDARYITPNCDALYINLGTLTKKRLRQIIFAGKIANKHSVPIILDPVGAGASAFRKNAAKYLMRRLDISVIRGNRAEIVALFSGELSVRGVDCDVFADDNLMGLTKNLSKKTGAVIICSGEYDIVTDGDTSLMVCGGHHMLKKVTGAGCMLGAITSAFVGSKCESILNACVNAVCAMKVCSELAFESLGKDEGNASYRNRLIDAFYHLDEKTLKEKSRYVKL